MDHGGRIKPLASDVVTTATVDPMDSLRIMPFPDCNAAPNHTHQHEDKDTKQTA